MIMVRARSAPLGTPRPGPGHDGQMAGRRRGRPGGRGRVITAGGYPGRFPAAGQPAVNRPGQQELPGEGHPGLP